MQQELVELKNSGLDTERIKPLTLINIDTLILLAPSIVSGFVRLEELLEHFIFVMTAVPDPGLHTAKQAEQMFTDATLPFSLVSYNYMQSRFGGEWHSEALMGKLLEKAKIAERMLEHLS